MSDEEDKTTIAQKIVSEKIEGVQIEKENLATKIFNAPSPKKKVEEYLNHPLNFDQEISTGRIIRGVEGIIGNLDRAMVDVILGVIEKVFKIVSTKRRTE